MVRPHHIREQGAERVSFDVALAGADSLLEMVSGGRLICDPAAFPVPIADPSRLMVGGLDDGHWPEAGQ